MKGVHVFTCAAANYLPKVRVLFDSLRRRRPDWTLHLAIADAPPSQHALASVGADEIHQLSGVGIPDWRAWVFCHSLIELATGVKPFALRHILARPDCAAAIYLDPDIAVFSDLAEIVEALVRNDIVLTPHLTKPEPDLEGILANEICTAQHGVYNLGFIAVAARAEGLAFADWWRDRVYRFCREDIPNGLYTDQRWVDFVPAFFERVKVLRSPSLNVAPWNMSTRQVKGTLDRGFTVNDEPLGFFHFSQVDRLDGSAMTGGQPAVAELLDWYRRQTRPTAAERDAASQPWAFASFDDGEPVSAEQRLVYRLRGDLQRAYPDPFATGERSFAAWWRGQAAEEFPGLFDPATRQTEIARLTSALTTGYAGLGRNIRAPAVSEAWSG